MIESEYINDLAFEIHRDTGLSSRVKDRVDHPAYRKITAMGKAAVPTILKRLEEPLKLGHWEFAALQEIIGAGPEIPEDHRGRIGMMAQDWLEWARHNWQLYSDDLVMYTIYDRPKDYPLGVVIRRWRATKASPEPVPDETPFRLCISVQEARQYIPLGLVCFRRAETDDPCIVETWL